MIEYVYKVIFNNDEKNYEEFDNLEQAERFALQYMNSRVIKVRKII